MCEAVVAGAPLLTACDNQLDLHCGKGLQTALCHICFAAHSAAVFAVLAMLTGSKLLTSMMTTGGAVASHHWLICKCLFCWCVLFAGSKLRTDLMADGGVAPVKSGAETAALLGGMEEQFAFSRAVSRLYEMQSPLYAAARPR
jgi:hypothetical protein